jgi:hypothetical protein
MTCPSCKTHSMNTHSGAYHFGCLDCCTRLVLSTRPNKAAAAGMLAAIARYPQNPGRERILESVRQALTKHPLASTSAGLPCERD